MSISGSYPNQGLVVLGTGPSSGINYTTILNALNQSLSEPITLMQQQETPLNNQLSVWKTISSDVSALNSAAAALGQPSLFQTYTANSSNTSVATATASSSAIPGTYNFSVNQLAQASEIASQGIASTSTAVGNGTGTFGITVNGTTTNVALNSTTGYTLQDLAQAINNAGAGVSAAIINDGSSNNPYRLVLTSNTTGTNGAITITNTLSGGTANLNLNTSTINPAYWNGTPSSGDTIPTVAGTYTGTASQTYTFTVGGTGTQTVGTNAITINWTNSSGQNGSFTVPSSETGTTSYYIDGSGSSNSTNSGIELSVTAGQTLTAGDSFSSDAFNPTMQTAQNAIIDYGNTYIQSQTNTVTNAIPGVTLSLLSTGSTSLSVGIDTQTIDNAVNSFISAYNQVVSDVATQNKITSSGSGNTKNESLGPLGGNAALSNLVNTLYGFADSEAPTLTGSNGLPSTYGITSNSSGSGQLSLNTATLNSMLTSNPQQTQQFFSALVNGSSSADGVSMPGGLTNFLNTYTNPANGVIQFSEAQINAHLTNMNNQISLQQTLVQEQMGMYTKEFSNLESYIGQMQTTNSNLTDSIKQLPTW
ncbi:MAG: flagellar filament capping protein FliD [bacterium]